MSDVFASAVNLFSNSDRKLEKFLIRNCSNGMQVPFRFLEYVSNNGIPRLDNKQHHLTNGDVRFAYRQILQRSPESHSVIQEHIDNRHSLNDLALALLLSQEWSINAARYYAAAFPDRKILWHVHIPKTAGTSFWDAAMATGMSFINLNMLPNSNGDINKIIEAMRFNNEGEIFISGHRSLSELVPAIRPWDRVITFIRNPVDLVLSSFNYALDVFNSRDNVHRGNPEEFISLGFDPESFERTYESDFIVKNMQCLYLGKAPTCNSAMSSVIDLNVEIFPVESIGAAVEKEFGIKEKIHRNVSTRALRRESISQKMLERIIADNAEDYALYLIAQNRFGISNTANR